MFTVCPKCTLTLVVTTVDLRAGQGYVRCGRCANVFNALVALREGEPSAGGSTSDSARRRLLETPPTGPIEPAMGAGVAVEADPQPEVAVPEEPPQELLEEPQPEPVPEEETLAQAEAEPITDTEVAPEFDLSFEPPQEEPAQSDEASLEFDPSATDVAEIFISPEEAEHDTASGNYEAVVLGESEPEFTESGVDPHTDTIAAEDWSLLDEEPHADAESIIEESPLAQQADPESAGESSKADPPWVEEMFAEAEAEAVRVRTGERRTLAQPPPVADDAAAEENDSAPERAAADATDATDLPDDSDDAELGPLLEPAKPSRPPWQYIGGISLLVLVLILQLLHHNRQRLVLSPAVGPMVSTVYGWFGSSLTPLWDLTAYTVKQLGAEAEGSEGLRLRVRLSVQNDSERVQPLPLLRLTLQDRFGKPVATRDLEPKDYLPPRAADLRLLEPDQRIDAELHVIDPGKSAYGFEIDACLRSETGSIGCANDARRRAAG